MKRILVTGGAGFIGSNFIRLILSERKDWIVTNFDALTYAGNLENLKGADSAPAYRFVKGDIGNRDQVKELFADSFDLVVNFAAESHVDRSVLSAAEFIRTNVTGTMNLLEESRNRGVGRFLQISTDEVYGDLADIRENSFSERTPLNPSSPYSASKASADMLAMSYRRTYSMPVLITRCSNNYGPYQFPEKLIPLVIYKAFRNENIPVYGDGMNIREWIYVEDHCRGILNVLENGAEGSVYNIGSAQEMTNLAIIKTILDIMSKPHDLIMFVKDRPGHDRRYAIDSSKIESELSFKCLNSFEDGIRKTVDWYLSNMDWIDRCVSGEYMKYYDANYSIKQGKV